MTRILSLMMLWLLTPLVLLPWSAPATAQGSAPAALFRADVKAMLAILGPDARPFIITSDPVADRQERERVVREYEESHSLAMTGETKAVLQIGKDDWPMPIPLVKEDADWRYDTPAGKEEILNRRNGRNELAAIEVC